MWDSGQQTVVKCDGLFLGGSDETLTILQFSVHHDCVIYRGVCWV